MKKKKKKKIKLLKNLISILRMKGRKRIKRIKGKTKAFQNSLLLKMPEKVLYRLTVYIRMTLEKTISCRAAQAFLSVHPRIRNM